MNAVTPYITVSGDTVVTTEDISIITENHGNCIRGIVSQAEKQGKKYDLTYGKKTRGIIVYHNGDVVLTTVSVDTLVNRIFKQEKYSTQRGS